MIRQLNIKASIMLDKDGYRPNVGIVICNDKGQVFWAKRIGQKGWQFPQGGIDNDETSEEAMYRELLEETGLQASDVEILGVSSDWLKYRLPAQYLRKKVFPLCIGQKQRWYLLKLTSDIDAIDLQANQKPEFDAWRWVSYWYPVTQVIFFKRAVYKRALKELSPFMESLRAKARKENK
jgi:putative (di)nucleoside polyphosphate hydrolase